MARRIRKIRSSAAAGLGLVDLLIAISIVSIALLVFISAALTARGAIDKSQYMSIATQSAANQRDVSRGSASSLTVGTTNSAVTGIPQGQMTTTVSTYGGSNYLKREDISVTWGAASSKTAFSAGALSFSTLISLPNHITSLYNAGTDNAGGLLALGSVDPHWTLVSGPVTGSVYVPPPDVNWTARTSNSQWISPSATQSQSMPTGTYQYRTTFTVTGPPSGLSIAVNGSPDDTFVDVQLNGVSAVTNVGHWTSWTSFTITSGFVTGTNTLDFYVSNPTGGPGGMQIQMTPSN